MVFMGVLLSLYGLYANASLSRFHEVLLALAVLSSLSYYNTLLSLVIASILYSPCSMGKELPL